MHVARLGPRPPTGRWSLVRALRAAVGRIDASATTQRRSSSDSPHGEGGGPAAAYLLRRGRRGIELLESGEPGRRLTAGALEPDQMPRGRNRLRPPVSHHAAGGAERGGTRVAAEGAPLPGRRHRGAGERQGRGAG